MQPFECTGQWWLPENEKDSTIGTLKVSQTGDLRLWLVGSLGPMEMLKSKAHAIILGRVDKSPVGHLVTLSGCMMGGSTFGSGTITRENYHASRAYFGAHLKSQDDLTFRYMSLQVGGGADWAHTYTGFVDQPFPAERAEEPAPVLSYTHRNPLVAKVPGGQLTLGVGFGTQANYRERSFHESVALSISCDTAKTSDQLDREYVYPLQNLMTFVCDRPQELLEFMVRRADFLSTPGEPTIRVVGPRVQPDEEEGASEPVRFFQMLFTLADVDFSDFIGQWLRVTEKYADACSIFFGLLYGPPAYIDLTFPSVVQAMCLYYFRRDDGVTRLAEEQRRLKEILTVLPPIDGDWIVERLGTRPVPPLQIVLRMLVEEHSDIMNPLVSARQDRFVSEVVNTLSGSAE